MTTKITADQLAADVAAVPNPRLVLAAEAVEAPVPPLATDRSAPDQLLLFTEVRYPCDP